MSSPDQTSRSGLQLMSFLGQTFLGQTLKVANGEGRGMRMRGTDAHLSSLMREMCAAMIDRDHL